MRYDPSLPDDGINVSPTHPLREAALLVAGIVGAVVVFALVVAVSVDLLVPLLPPKLETRIFSFSWAGALGAEEEAGEADPVDPRQTALQELVDRLARHWPENPYAFRAVLWEDEQVNALALPGGWVAVTSGLLEQAGSENEVAFVLGHELGHFRNRDHLRGLGRGLALGLVLVAAGASGSGVATDLAGLAGQLAQRGFDRQQESDADAFGLELVALEYGHVAGATDFFGRTPDAADVLGAEIAAYLSTHPLHQHRLKAMLDLAAERGWSREGALVPFEAAVP